MFRLTLRPTLMILKRSICLIITNLIFPNRIWEAYCYENKGWYNGYNPKPEPELTDIEKYKIVNETRVSQNESLQDKNYQLKAENKKLKTEKVKPLEEKCLKQELEIEIRINLLKQ